MQVIEAIAAMQRRARRWRREGRNIGFVPTMGFLHDGHLSLVAEARRRVGRQGRVVLSLFVNPTQFAPHEDFNAYPRDAARDAALCRAAGVDVLFAPTTGEVYPGRDTGDYSTYVVEESLSLGMEGGSRPTHFRGVTTVVAKLFNMVLPDVAVFGAKDWQQAMIIQRMARDLNFPLAVVVAPTVREPDGLAMSSRNKYLTAVERPQATVLWRSLEAVRTRVRRARGSLTVRTAAALVARLVAAQPAARLDYVAFFDPATLRPAKRVGPDTHMALAVFVGRTRLIDNGPLG